MSAGTHHPGVEVGDAIALAMAQIIPDRCSPQTYKYGSPRQMWGDLDPRTGKPFFDHGGETNAGWVNGGQGRRRVGCARAPSNGNLIKASAEMNETLFPHMLRGRNYLTDSGGAGQWRGGCGSLFVKEVRTPTLRQPVRREPVPHPSRASPAAATARPTRATSRSAAPEDQVIRSTRRSPACCSRPASGSSTTSAAAAAGATRSLRDPQAVLDDVWDEYVSIEGAARDYGVVITGSLEDMDLALDAAATEARRAEMRAARVVTGYRIGIDVGGTFTDLVRPPPGRHRRAREGADDADRPVAGRARRRSRAWPRPRARRSPTLLRADRRRSCTARPPATTP